MEQRTDPLQQNLAETRHDIEETRASMTEKLELLEERVRGTLEETKSAVGDIVENVKGTVEETVGAVKETVDGAKSTVENIVENVKGTMDDTVTMVKQSFDLRYQVEQHPWLMVGGSVIAGSLLASFLNRDSGTRSDYRYTEVRPIGNYVADTTGGTGPYSISGQESVTRSQAATNGTPAPSPRGLRSTLGQFQEEFDLVKGAMMGAVMSTVMGTLQEMIRQNIPSMAAHFDSAANRVAKKWEVEPHETAKSPQPENGGSHTQPTPGSFPSQATYQVHEPYKQGK